MKIGVIADTHIPVTAKALPARMLEGLKDVDLILHAGDLVELYVLDELNKISPTEAVAGNMDSFKVKKALPNKKILAFERFKIGLIHGWGAPYHLLDNIRKEFANDEDISCIVYAHSHIPGIETIEGVIYLNPGSPTDKIFAPYNSYGILDINDKIEPHIIRI